MAMKTQVPALENEATLPSEVGTETGGLSQRGWEAASASRKEDQGHGRWLCGQHCTSCPAGTLCFPAQRAPVMMPVPRLSPKCPGLNSEAETAP